MLSDAELLQTYRHAKEAAYRNLTARSHEGAHIEGLRAVEAQASRPFTEEDVEVASEAFGGVVDSMWARASDWEREHVRRQMRAALAAVYARNTARHTKGD